MLAAAKSKRYALSRIRRMIPFALLGAGLTWLVFEKILGVVVPQPFWLGLF